MKAVSLFTGAGGMDVGFKEAGFDVIWANDNDKDSCLTYEANHKVNIIHGDINDYLHTLPKSNGIDLVFGGPPCQGFSVAGKMDPHDPRNKLIWSFADVVNIVKPESFVLENVKALASLSRWEGFRREMVKRFESLGYFCDLLLLNSASFGVPQSRERMFLIGIKGPKRLHSLQETVEQYAKTPHTITDIVKSVGKAGSKTNTRKCNAKITFAKKPVLRKSPYAGMLFNGQGRPLNPNGVSSTLPASMGGNRTPIIDEDQIFSGKPSWVEKYHSYLMDGGIPYEGRVTPKRLRRITIDEALRIQTFSEQYVFHGSRASVYKQIGNAVPCRLAHAVGMLVKEAINGYAC